MTQLPSTDGVRAGAVTCPSCQHGDTGAFYDVAGVPVHSARIVGTRQDAIDCTKGRILLRVCRGCGFIYNAAFDPALLDYSPGYEPTQGCSDTFNAYQRRLVAELVERYDVRGRRVVEIGCGDGGFLRLLCEAGRNHGTGFDPAYDGPDEPSNGRDWSVRFVRDVYADQSATGKIDVICSRMTLEHVRDVAGFMRLAYRGVGGNPRALVFVQVPDVDRVLREVAFWDIYYEHCSYFGAGSLTKLFERSGFTVRALWHDYGDQYLGVIASPRDAALRGRSEDLERAAARVERFAQQHAAALLGWNGRLAAWSSSGHRAVLWGGGSKAVAFLRAVEAPQGIGCVVDINPRKHHTYVAGTGHEIVPPSFLRAFRPDIVVVMNPVYLDEIRRELMEMQLGPKLVAVDHPARAKG
jgi:SAM-dependent methyltransferase